MRTTSKKENRNPEGQTPLSKKKKKKKKKRGGEKKLDFKGGRVED